MQNMPQQQTADKYPPPRQRGGPTEGIQKGLHSTCRLASLLQCRITPAFKHVLAGKEDWYTGLLGYVMVVQWNGCYSSMAVARRGALISVRSTGMSLLTGSYRTLPMYTAGRPAITSTITGGWQ